MTLYRCLLLAAALAAGAALAQQPQPPGKTTEQQARSYVASAFMTGAAPLILSEDANVSPALRQRLGLAADANSRAVYQAIVTLTGGKAVQVRRASPEEVTMAQAPSAPEKPVFAIEAGDTTLIVQYDLERDNIAFVGQPGVTAVAAPVTAPAAPERVPDPAPVPPVAAPTPPPAPVAPPAPAAPPVAAAEPAPKPAAPVLQTVEPQVPRAAKPSPPPAPVAAAVRPAPPAQQPQQRTEPRLRPNGECVIKPVMSDQDLVNCGATPR
jgi:hypothetical protein